MKSSLLSYGFCVVCQRQEIYPGLRLFQLYETLVNPEENAASIDGSVVALSVKGKRKPP